METDKTKLKQDLDSFDIDEVLFQEKERIDKRVQDYIIRLKALKLSRGI